MVKPELVSRQGTGPNQDDDQDVNQDALPSLAEVLEKAGLRVALPAGTYFILADFSGLFEGDDVAFARSLVETRGVAAIPPSGFYSAAKDEGRRLIRFAFSKRMETLRAAGERLLGRS